MVDSSGSRRGSVQPPSTSTILEEFHGSESPAKKTNEEASSSQSPTKSTTTTNGTAPPSPSKSQSAAAAPMKKPIQSRKKKIIGISFDQVSQQREKEREARERETRVKMEAERERAEREGREWVEREKERERERVEREKAKNGGQEKVVPVIEQAVGMDSKTEGQGTETATKSTEEGSHETTAKPQSNQELPIPLPSEEDPHPQAQAQAQQDPIPPTIAEQILVSQHPEVAARLVAEVIAEKQEEGSSANADGDAKERVASGLGVDPVNVALPTSRAETPIPTQSRAGQDVQSPLDAEEEEEEKEHEERFQNLTLGGASYTPPAHPERTTVMSPPPNLNPNTQSQTQTQNDHYPSWGRAFEEQIPTQSEPEPKSSSAAIAEGGMFTAVQQDEGNGFDQEQGEGWAFNAVRVSSPLDAVQREGAYSGGWQVGQAQGQGIETPIMGQQDGLGSVSDYLAIRMLGGLLAILSQPEQTSPSATRSPSIRNRILAQPMFQITISDPTKVGDPVRGYIVYTVTTRTTSPHYKRGEFSVLRRFSDFLWLGEVVAGNNMGVIVPPMPDKHAFGMY